MRSLTSVPGSLSERVAALVAKGVVEKLAAIEGEITRARDGAIAWTVEGIRKMHAAGKLLSEAQELLAGDYTDWFESNSERIGFCLRTSGTYKKVFRDIEALGGWDQACSAFPDRHDFLVALGVLKAREPSDKSSGTAAPIFSLSLKLNAPEPEKWPSMDRRDFLQRAKPVVDLYERVRAAEEAA